MKKDEHVNSRSIFEGLCDTLEKLDKNEISVAQSNAVAKDAESRIRSLNQSLNRSKVHRKINHFELTTETKKNAFGIKLHRIRCTRAVQNVKEGDLGGWIQKKRNLSGQAWIYDDAEVFGHAVVTDHAQVRNNSIVHGCAKVMNHAKVLDKACIYAKAVLKDNSKIYGCSQVSGTSILADNSQAFDNTLISSNSMLSGASKAFGNTWIFNSKLSDQAEVSGHAIVSNCEVSGRAKVYGFAELSENISGSMEVFGSELLMTEAYKC